nr:unnamed protein product [Callosobruchus chinensis]
MICHVHVSSIATASRKYFSPSNLLTLYKAQIRPSLEYCSHTSGELLPPLPCLYLMQSREGKFDLSVSRS